MDRSAGGGGVVDHQQYNEGQAKAAPVPLTAEEARLLKECSRDALYQRGLPAAVLGAGLAALAVRRGFLKPNQTFGAIPKALGFGYLGYVVGTISYVGKVQERFLNELPHSAKAQEIRRVRGMAPYDEDAQLHQDAEQPEQEWLRQQRPDVMPGGEEQQGGQSFSYDELRKAHRSRQAVVPPPPAAAPSAYPPPAVAPVSPYSHFGTDQKDDTQLPSGQRRAKVTNKYGDVDFE